MLSWDEYSEDGVTNHNVGTSPVPLVEQFDNPEILTTRPKRQRFCRATHHRNRCQNDAHAKRVPVK